MSPDIAKAAERAKNPGRVQQERRLLTNVQEFLCNLCESEKADPEHPDTISINRDDLELLARQHGIGKDE